MNLQRFMATTAAPAPRCQPLLFHCGGSLGYLDALQGKSVISGSGVLMQTGRAHRGEVTLRFAAYLFVALSSWKGPSSLPPPQTQLLLLETSKGRGETQAQLQAQW